MERERVAFVTDSGSSMRAENPEVKEMGVSIVPLEVKFWEVNQFVSYSDDKISSEEFYKRMDSSSRTPQTAGAHPGSFMEVYQKLTNKAQTIISLHVSSKLSGVFQTANLVKNYFTDDPSNNTKFEIVDTKSVSAGTWFSTETGIESYLKGASVNEILNNIQESINKTHVLITLSTFDNLKKGGRGKEIVEAILASTLSIYPVLGVEGSLKKLAYVRSANKARDRMVEMVGDAGKIVKMAIIHTNAPNLANEILERVRKMYAGTIEIREAGPVLAVHAGKDAVCVAYQTG